jgi:thiosulfate/3-mercaptopyruvate sulfurtransferase
MAEIGILSPAQLADQLGSPDLVILDGSYYLPALRRDADAEYRERRIPGALRFDIDAVKDTTSNLPHMLPTPEAFAAAAGALGIGNDTLVVAYDGLGLMSAARVAWTFRTFGAERVAILDGGFPAWLAEGRPVETGPPRSPQPRSFTPRFDAGAVADLDRVRQALATGSAQVVDARSAARFTGEEAEPRAGTRSGHMPGAFNLHYGSIVKDGRLADTETIEAAVREAGIDPDRPIVTTCGSGVTAAILSMAFERIGRPAQALYDGSWSEWGARDDTPVETGPARPGVKSAGTA